MNPYVFLVGCPRSGTTLLQRIVDAHPEIAVINEAQWVPQWWERRVGIAPDGTVTPRLVRELIAHRRFSRLELDAERVEELVQDGHPKHYARFVTELFDLHGQVKGKRLVGEKSPGYVRHLPSLNALWPQTKIVHLIRDGRDVSLSALDWKKSVRMVGRYSTWEEDRVATAALWWEWHVRLGRDAAGLFEPERYCELRYESLVADPEGGCAKLSAFLGVSYDDAMLRFHEGRQRVKPGRASKAAWLPVTPGLRRWEEQMRSGDVARFEAAAGPLLEELGYPRVASLSGQQVRSSARLREAFADDARARRRAVPEAWQRETA
jgi:hypothetical protein